MLVTSVLARIQQNKGKIYSRMLLSAPALTLLGTFIAAVVVTSVTGPFLIINTIVTGGMWALIAAGLSLTFGVMNIVSFIHGDFFMLGALVSYFVYNAVSKYIQAHPSTIFNLLAPFSGIIAAFVVISLLGALIERGVFYQLRKRSREQWVMNAFLLTVGLSLIIVNGSQLIWGNKFRGVTKYWDLPAIQILNANISVDRMVAFILAILIIIGFWLFLSKTRLGRAVRAVSQDEVGAQMVGINLNKIHLFTFSISCGLAAIAGAALLFMFPAYPTMGLKPLYTAWFIVILAGLGNVHGAIIGGFIVAFLQQCSSYFLAIAWEDVVPTVLMVFLLLIRPLGIFGTEVRGINEQ